MAVKKDLQHPFDSSHDRALRAQLAVVCNNATVALFIMDERQEGSYMNPAAELLTGFTLTEVKGRALHDIIHHSHPDGSHYPLSDCPIDRAFPERNRMQGEEIFVHKDGHFYPVAYTASPVRDDLGRTIGTVIEVRDISQEKEARQFRERFVEVSADMLAMAKLDGYFTWLSPSWERVLGWTPQELLSHPWLHFVHPEDVPETIAEAQSLGEGRETSSFENRYRHRDGSYRWISWRTRPYVENNETVLYCTARDVTAYKEAQEMLDRQRRLYESVLNNTPDLAYVVGPDHRFIYANDALLKLCGKSLEEVQSKTSAELDLEQWLPILRDQEIARVIKTSKLLQGEALLDDSSGHRLYDYILAPVLGADGCIEAIAGTARDVSERKAAEGILKEAARRKDEFIATLAHELRNPLAPIRNGLVFLKRSNDVVACRGVEDMMERQLLHMTRLIDDLLDVSRITTGKVLMKKESLSLQEVLRFAVESSLPAIEAHRHTFTQSIPEDPIAIYADGARIAQVVSNLLTNAAKYTPNGGEISLTVSTEEGQAVIVVQDNGIGIPPNMLSKVFGMFTQVNRALGRSQAGLGIGLALVEYLTRIHDGTVEAASAGEGLGSTFTVRLPLAEAQAQAQAVSPPPLQQINGETPSVRPLKVLIVDDNMDSADSLSLLAQLDGHTTSVAYSGRAAVNAAREFKPDLVFLDIGLPDIDGYQVARTIRATPALSQTMLVAMTGWGTDKDKADAKAAGFSLHLTKPINIDDVKTIMHSQVDAASAYDGKHASSWHAH